MAYMIYQQYTTAILDAYRESPEVADHLASARSHRMWLETLEIEDSVKASLVEQARAVEEAFQRLTSMKVDVRDVGVDGLEPPTPAL